MKRNTDGARLCWGASRSNGLRPVRVRIRETCCSITMLRLVALFHPHSRAPYEALRSKYDKTWARADSRAALQGHIAGARLCAGPQGTSRSIGVRPNRFNSIAVLQKHLAAAGIPAQPRSVANGIRLGRFRIRERRCKVMLLRLVALPPDTAALRMLADGPAVGARLCWKPVAVMGKDLGAEGFESGVAGSRCCGWCPIPCTQPRSVRKTKNPAGEPARF